MKVTANSTFITNQFLANRISSTKDETIEPAGTDSVELSDAPESTANSLALAWSALETAGVVAFRGVPSGTLGSVLESSQLEALRTVLHDIEDGGAQFYTGRGKKLTPRDPDYILDKVLVKNNANFRSNVWIGNKPIEEEGPDQIKNLMELRFAHSIYGAHPEHGVRPEHQSETAIIRGLDEAGYKFFQYSRRGNRSKEVGPVRAYRQLHDGRSTKIISVGREDDSRFSRHSLNNITKAGVVDFFYGSGQLASVENDPRAQEFKILSDQGFRLSTDDYEENLVETYEGFLQEKPLNVTLHQHRLGVIDSKATAEEIQTQREPWAIDLRQAQEALAPMEGKANKTQIHDYYRVVREPVQGLSHSEQGQLLSDLWDSLPKSLPGEADHNLMGGALGYAPGRSRVSGSPHPNQRWNSPQKSGRQSLRNTEQDQIWRLTETL